MLKDERSAVSRPVQIFKTKEKVLEILVVILGIVLIGLTWWDWENPDKKSIALGELDRKSARLNNERKSRQIAVLEEKIRKLNEENPGQLFYRAGARIKEHSPEEAARIISIQAEYERLNAPYASHQRHYFIIDGELVKADENTIKRYKYEEKRSHVNSSYRHSGSMARCIFDEVNMKLINTVTNEEIPFDPDEYVLTGD